MPRMEMASAAMPCFSQPLRSTVMSAISARRASARRSDDELDKQDLSQMTTRWAPFAARLHGRAVEHNNGQITNDQSDVTELSKNVTADALRRRQIRRPGAERDPPRSEQFVGLCGEMGRWLRDRRSLRAQRVRTPLAASH